MNFTYKNTRLFTASLFVVVLLFSVLGLPVSVKAQTPPFLGSPYYATAVVN